MEPIEVEDLDRHEQPMRVVVTDLDISMTNMFWLMIKFAIAAIPAALLLGFLGIILAAALKGLR